MRIKYLGKQIIVKWRGTDKETLFAPYAEVPDELGKRLLSNPDLLGQFEEMKMKEHICNVCGRDCRTAPALGAHSRTHFNKEKKSEKDIKHHASGRPHAGGVRSDVQPDKDGELVESGSDLDRQDLPEGQLLKRDG